MAIVAVTSEFEVVEPAVWWNEEKTLPCRNLLSEVSAYVQYLVHKVDFFELPVQRLACLRQVSVGVGDRFSPP